MFKWILAFSKLLDDTYAIRRASLLFCAFLTWETLHWAMRFADMHTDKPGIEVAAVIGAVSAVVAALQAFAFRDYLNSK